jgi:DNA (cytosine-5)-methyltransferase 1
MPGSKTDVVELSVVGLFAGIGGLEEGLRRAGHRAELLCEIDAPARAVLRNRFPDARLAPDIRKLRGLPDADVVAAGFPCQDLSPVGTRVGITGTNSGLVDEVFRLVRTKRRRPEWLVLENVPFMLQLQRGRAMKHVTQQLASLGYNWAYRIVDTRAFGLPQRRRRVVIVAARQHDPRTVLFPGNEPEPQWPPPSMAACGFYWTEGNRGLGWAVDAIPPLKGGSSLGIPSAPAVWLMNGQIGTPDIRDAERLQGFPANWTKPAEDIATRGARWRLIGNAVPVPLATWIGRRLTRPVEDLGRLDSGEFVSGRWPSAAWGDRNGKVFSCVRTEWPSHWAYKSLNDFMRFPLRPLSVRATVGFATRLAASRLRVPDELFDDLEAAVGRESVTWAESAV